MGLAVISAEASVGMANWHGRKRDNGDGATTYGNQGDSLQTGCVGRYFGSTLRLSKVI